MTTVWLVLLGVSIGGTETVAHLQQKADEAILGVNAVTGPTVLLTRLRQQSLTPLERRQIELAVERLGDPSFRIREQALQDLQNTRPGAVALLRKRLDDSDPERRRRIELALQKTAGRWPPAEEEAAIRLLKFYRPIEAVDALVAYVPFAGDEAVLHEIASALHELSEDRTVRLRWHDLIASADSTTRPFLEDIRKPNWRETSPTTRSFAKAQEFFDILGQGNLEQMQRIVRVPFSLGGDFGLRTPNQFNDFFGQVQKNYRDTPKKLALIYLHTVRGDDYFTQTTSDERQFLSPLPIHHVRAVYVRLRFNGTTEESGAVLVLLEENGARVIGLGHGSPSERKR